MRRLYPLLLAILMAGCAERKPATVPTPPSTSPSTPPSAPPPPRPTKREPPPPRPAKTEPPPPPRVLSPQASDAEEERLKQEVQTRIAGAEQVVKQIGQRKLAQDQQETFSTIRSFLAKAKEALSLKDFPRAFILADKAKVLADELLSAPR